MKSLNYKHTLFVLALVLLIGIISIQAQSSCTCQSESCSATQTCPKGYLAVCVCSQQCGSECQKAEEGESELYETGGQGLIIMLAGWDETAISREFTRVLGKQVDFVKSPELGSLAPEMRGFRSYWEIAEYLSKNGTLTINRLPFEIWKHRREGLLSGQEFTICANDVPARTILGLINFLSGKDFTITAGDPRATSKSTIRGRGLEDVLRSLSDTRGVKISSTEGKR